MKPLFTNSEFSIAKSTDKLPCECYYCQSTFLISKHQIQRVLNPNAKHLGKFCSKKCQFASQITKIKLECSHCHKTFNKHQNQIKKSNKHFCSKSCSVTYYNLHKTTGNRRSKLELWLEQQLSILYPNLKIHYNRKDAIDSELDIYIPSVKIAFELNGIFHYEPVFGNEKFNKIQNNDERKFQACIEKGISLCVIDTSSLKYFKEKNAMKYLNIITSTINQRTC